MKLDFNKKKIEVLIAVLLVSILTVLILKVFIFSGDSKKIKNGFSHQETQRGKIDFQSLEEKFKGMKWRRNPFELSYLTTIQGQPRSSFLKGTLLSGDSSLAIFGEDTFKKGERIDKYLILEIGKDYVILSDGEATYKLSVGQSLEAFDGKKNP